MREGELVAERFEIERSAGTGGMGIVYRAQDRQRGVPVALKVLNALGRTQTERFAREARALSELRHPGIVEYVANGTTPDGEPYLVMAWLEGEDLNQRLAREGLTLRESVTLTRRVAEALAAAHARGIVHRDVKTKNLFLEGGDVERVKLLDFGVARLGEGVAPLTKTGLILGTPGYTAPEQARGSRNIDARADVFALGCVLFRCLTGQAAFTGEDMVAVLAKVLFEPAPTVAELRPEIPPLLNALVARMLAKDPAERPRDGGAVAAELEAIERSLAGEGDRAPAFALPSLLTGSEQRLVSVVVVDVGDRMKQEVTVERDGEPDAEGAEQSTGGMLSGAIAHFGAKLEVLANGCVVAMLTGNASATDQAAQGARCALAMRAVVPGAPIALATGRGELGARWSLGEVIDRAADLLRDEESGGRAPAARHVRLDDVTAGLLDARFEVHAEGAAFELRGEREATDQARLLLGRPVPCVGRERELRMLRAVLDECAAEPVARAVLVTGPAGIGKSRLRYELVRQVSRAGTVQVWLARSDPMSAGSPLGMLAQVVRGAAGILDGEPLPTRQRKLRARLSRHFARAELDRMTEFIGELAQVPAPASEASPQLRAARRDALVMGDQMRRAWEDLLRAECAQKPLLLVLEDLHWGDWPTIRFVDSALRALSDRPLMVLALSRPEVHELFPGLWEGRPVTETALGALTRKASEKLVREVLGEGATSETVGRLVEHAQGNAFYLEELIRSAAEGHGEKLPDTVLAMVQARLEALPNEARRTLRAASVFGQVFWDDGVVALLGGAAHADEIRSWLAELVARELVTRRGEAKLPGLVEYVFRHALVREAAYAMLTESDRMLGHKLAGQWLERSGAGDAMALAEHFERGLAPERAVAWFMRASEQALGGNDFTAVVARADRGIACGAQGGQLGALLLLRAEAYRWLGEFAESEAAGLRALEVLPRGSADWCFAAGGVAMAKGQQGDGVGLVSLAKTLAAIEVGDDAKARLAVALARAAMHVLAGGMYDELPPLLDRMGVLIDSMAAPDAESRAWVHRVRGACGLYAGDLAAFLHNTERALPLFEEVGDVRAACMQRENLGDAYKELGLYEKAETFLREAINSAAGMSLNNATGVAGLNLGLVLARRGALDEARAMEARAADSFRVQGAVRLEGGARAYLAAIEAMRGDLEAATREVRRAVEILGPVPPLRPLALGTLARIELAEGRPGDALAHAREAMHILESLGQIEEGEALVRLVHAEALQASGEHAAARAAIAVASERLNARADKIGDAELRACFLEKVPDNARTLELERAWATG